MTADSVSVVDAVVTDLIGNVTGLSAANCPNVHKYAPWDPDKLDPDAERHLAVWPVADVAEEGGDYTNLSQEIVTHVAILIWESSNTEDNRMAEDQAGDQAFLELHFAARARLLQPAQAFGGAYLVKYVSTVFGGEVRLVRWVQMEVECRRYVALA